MNTGFRLWAAGVIASCCALAGCQVATPYDYTNFRAHPPRSILVLPPLNESMAIEGTYGYLSTLSRPIVERGYYVFPVAVIDQFMKDNGLPTAGEMHSASIARMAEVTGADAVLFVTLKQYGSTYQVISSTTRVEAIAKLIDTRSGILLWEGRGFAEQSSGSSDNPIATLIAAAITQAINKKSDQAHQVSRLANANLINPEKTGLPYGPYNPKYRSAH